MIRRRQLDHVDEVAARVVQIYLTGARLNKIYETIDLTVVDSATKFQDVLRILTRDSRNCLAQQAERVIVELVGDLNATTAAQRTVDVLIVELDGLALLVVLTNLHILNHVAERYPTEAAIEAHEQILLKMSSACVRLHLDEDKF